MPLRVFGLTLSLFVVAAATGGFLAIAQAPAAHAPTSYSLSTYNCSAKTNCDPAAQTRRGAWSTAAHDRTETETGTPFEIATASGPAFYGKSTVAIQAGGMTLSNHIQMANFQKWTAALKRTPATGDIGPAFAGGNITDTLTITGAEGDAYFLPVYKVDGMFASPTDHYLESYVALCPGTAGGCGPIIRRSPGGVSNIHEVFQPKPAKTLQVRLGVPFRYSLGFYSRILPPHEAVAETLSATFRDDETVNAAIQLAGVMVTDQNGREIPGVKVTSESGMEYPLLHPSAAPAQTQTAVATSAIAEGDVVNAVTNAPVAGARLKLSAEEPLYARADAQGHFAFRNLRPGSYSLAVEYPGFLQPRTTTVDLTPPRPAGRVGAVMGAVSYSYPPSAAPAPKVTKSVDVDGTLRASITVPLMAYAAISGKVTDPFGMPVVDSRIEILMRAPPLPAGMPAPPGRQSEYTTAGSSVTTDDRGEFRVGRLEPGSYWVVANKGSSSRSTWQGNYRITYYPAALDPASAQPLALGAGQEGRADIKLLTRDGVRVSGRLVRPPGAPLDSSPYIYTRIALTPVNSALLNPDTPFTNGQDDYELRDVLPGTYTLSALTEDASTDLSGPNRKRMYGLLKEVVIGQQDMAGFDLALEPLKDLAGTVTFREGCTAAPMTVRLQGRNPLASPVGMDAITDAAGAFILHDVPPGKFTVGLSGSSNSMAMGTVSSMQRGSRDVLKDGLEAPLQSEEVLKIVMDCRNSGRRQ